MVHGKKIFLMIIAVILSGCSLFNPSSSNSNPHINSSQTGGDSGSLTSEETNDSSEINKKEAVLLSVEGATIDIDKKEVNMFVDENTTSVSLSNKITCSLDATWKLYYDKLGQTEIPTKIAASKDGSLKNGDNVFYIVVTSSDKRKVNVYTLTIYKSFLITLTYLFNNNVLKIEKIPTGYEKALDYVADIEGYKFNYWMDNNNKKINKITPYENVTFYANVTANQYTVTLDPNGGNISNNTKVVAYASNYVLPIPTRRGYTFAGWYDGNTQLTNEKGQSLSSWLISHNVTIEAKWTINEYVLSLVNSNNEAGNVTGAGTYIYNSSVTVTAVANEGYKFGGWYNSNGICISNESIYTFSMGLSNTLTAKWECIDITLNYIVNGNVVHTETYTLDEHINISYTCEVGEDEVFYGWYETPNFDSNTTMITTTQGLVIKSNTTYIYGAIYDKTLQIQDFTFTYKNSGYSITGYLGEKTNVRIPEIINGICVNEISTRAFEHHTNIYSVSIPSSVKSIGYYSFAGCTSLASIHIPSSVESIDDYAFSDCSSLTSIIIPNSITHIGFSILSNCNSLEKISTPSIGSYFGYLFGASSHAEVNKIPHSLREVSVRGGRIKRRAFYGCDFLTKLDCTGYIEDEAFFGCYSLESVTFFNKDKLFGKIFTTEGGYGGEAVIQYNSSNEATKYYIPKVKEVRTSLGVMEGAFSGCHFIESMLLSAEYNSSAQWYNFKTLGRIFGSHSYSWATETIQPNSYSTRETYYVPDDLKKIIIEGGDYIDAYTFMNCGYLETVVIENGITKIWEGAFSNCWSLETIVIPESVSGLGDAFYGCNSWNFTIYCEAISQPTGWSDTWNKYNHTVYWGGEWSYVNGVPTRNN